MANSVTTYNLPLLPLRKSVLFPSQIAPLMVGRSTSIAAVEAAMARQGTSLATLTQRDETAETITLEGLYPIGSRAVITHTERTEAGLEAIVSGVERIRLMDLVPRDGYVAVLAEPWPMTMERTPEVEALYASCLDLGATFLSLLGQAQVSASQLATQFSDPLSLAYLLGSVLGLTAKQQYDILSADNLKDALQLALDHLMQAKQVQRLRQKITSQAESEMNKERKEYLLRQQLRAIQHELGEEAGSESETGALREKLQAAGLPQGVLKEAVRELGRLDKMNPAAPDYQLTRTYLEFMSELPWDKDSEDLLDLPLARKVLDEDHYGLKEIKERILEHLAVMKLNPAAKSPILCLVGPPGVGKTSLGQSIARDLGRSFERTSLGGLHDEAELRGHRRTYVGAMPGRLIQAVRRAGVKNPVLMLDEIDKLGRDFRGDPAAALMEILDPAQNHGFRDNYLDVPFDLSRVFFIATANTLDGIPAPLLDRMEVLRLSGYSEDEKAQIADRYLIPRQIQDVGLSEGEVTFAPETVMHVIRRYTREAGVRQLERSFGRLLRKMALRFAESTRQSTRVMPDDVADLLGPERHFHEAARRDIGPGVATGLAWTEAGGEVLYVEALALGRGDGLTITGQLGDVMQESVKAARSYVLSRAGDLRIPDSRLRHPAVHVHVPAGATPKDGPSAGVALASALASLYSGQPVRSDVGMTGEISLSGLVFPVGGVKEKVLAAHRAGLAVVILPKENLKDLRELPDRVKQEVEFVGVERVEEAWRVAIPGLVSALRLAA